MTQNYVTVTSPEDVKKVDYSIFTFDSGDPDNYSFEFNKDSDCIKIKFKDDYIILNKEQIHDLICFIWLSGLLPEGLNVDWI